MNPALGSGANASVLADVSALSALAESRLTLDSLGEFLHSWSELEKRIRSQETELRRRHYANTRDREAEERLGWFNREVHSRAYVARTVLVEKYLSVAEGSPQQHQSYLFKRFSADQRTGVAKNASLVAAEADLSNRYSAVVGGLRAVVGGVPLPLPRAAALQREADRGVREEAWRAEMEARLGVAAELDGLFLELVSLRQEIARNAGFANYLEYRWLERGRFDYTPTQCLEFVKAVAAHFGRLQGELMERRRLRLGVSSLRPWDINANLEGRDPLRPYRSADELVGKALATLESLDPALSGLLESMNKHGDLDLEVRADKSPSTFTDFYYDQRRPLIFMSANGTQSSVFALFHELGHANHWVRSSARQPLYWYQFAPAEFQEAAAQTLELLALPAMRPFFAEADLPRVVSGKVKGLLFASTSVLAKEVFQHWVYSQPPASLSPDLLRARYREIATEFDQPFDYTGLERFEAAAWQGSMLYWQPLYAVEYAVAWVGALLFIKRHLDDPGSALERYRHALEQGMALPMRELFAAAGVQDPLLPASVEAAAAFLREHYAPAFE